MEQSQRNYQLLIQKLDQFIRKYYINQLIRGCLYSLGLILAVFLIYNVLEYNYFFDTTGRKILFFSFIGISTVAIAFWVLTPLLNYFRLGKVINHEKAAQIIGDHFSDVKDKLINILQLKKQADQTEHADLLYAGINQKTEEIKPVPFRTAIDLSKNRKNLRYALPPLLILLTLFIAAPSVIKDSTNRILKNNMEFEREAPFQFIVNPAEELTVVQYDDYDLQINVDGTILPNEVFIDIDNYQFRMKKNSNEEFSYRFKNVQKDTEFKIFAGDVESRNYTLNVLKKPNIVAFDIGLDYPGYTGRRDETLSNIGDVVVPVGTRMSWNFQTLNTDEIEIKFGGKKEAAERKGEDLFNLSKRAMKDEYYQLYVSNKQLPNADSIQYTINVVPDQYPSINVEIFEDSTDNRLMFFVGNVSDDYGLRSLAFNYRMKNADGSEGPLESISLPMKNNKQFQYDHTFDIETLNLQPGQEVTYYFEIFDNDAVHGSKSSRTGVMSFRKPTADEFEDQEKENNEEIKDDLEETMKEAKQIQKEMKEMREKLLQEKKLEWQNKKDIENLLERQKEMYQKLQEAQEQFEENLKNQEEFSEPSEELLEKQEKVQELFEELMSEEMKELMKKFEEMLQELEKEGALEMMEDMEFNDEELEKELDRLLELFKQMEVEQEMQRQMEKLEELAEEQEKLSEETQKEEKSNEELQEEQEEINEKFDEIQKDMEDLQKKNEELERPKDMEGTDEQMEKIDQDMQNSQEQLEQQQNQKASESQKNAAQRMKDMAQQMSSQMMEGQMEQMQEDMAALRQLLENLITLSFDQEDLIGSFTKTNTTTPRYVALTQDQFKIKDDFKVVDDTLQALSKRVFQIESFVTEKVTEIKNNLRKSLDHLEERKKAEASTHQQKTMKNLNDLALMLSEVMDQMQQQMSSMMQGNQMCNKPGGGGGKSGNVPMDKITEGQQELNEEMKKMTEQFKSGQKGKMSKEFAQMAARQSALRKALEEIQQGKKEQGKGEQGLEEIMKQMDKIETDLVNKRLTNDMLKRQQDIVTRLLEAENAERQREMDQKRKAKTAQEIERKMPPSLEEYIKKRESEIEQYNTVSPSLKPYYKFLVEEYYNALKKQK